MSKKKRQKISKKCMKKALKKAFFNKNEVFLA